MLNSDFPSELVHSHPFSPGVSFHVLYSYSPEPFGCFLNRHRVPCPDRVHDHPHDPGHLVHRPGMSSHPGRDSTLGLPAAP